MNKNQNGIALIESLLIVLILVIVGFAGYYVWNTQHQNNKVTDDTLKASQSAPPTSSSPTGEKTTLKDGVSFLSPNGWQSAKPSGFCMGTDNSLSEQCVDSLELSPTDAKGAQTNDAFGVAIDIFKNSGSGNAKSWFFNTWCSCIASDDWSIATTSMNGYDSLEATQSNSDYTDVYYVVQKNSTIVMVDARTKETSSSRDASSYSGDIKQVADSIQISQ